MKNERKKHWENVYITKTPNQVSWTQEKPSTSIRLIESLKLPKSAAIIDIGGGDSNLVDHLLELGFKDITVLDISGKALERAKMRLGNQASQVNWIECDITEFKPERTYSVWHDRATFHFLTQDYQKSYYQKLVSTYLSEALVIGTFSVEGPLKCSGLEISQYDSKSVESIFSEYFELTETFTEDHTTPFETKQNFLFGCFLRKKNS